jgi:hypothetical protein
MSVDETDETDETDEGGQGGETAERAFAAIDIDGVIADPSHRLHLVERRPKDWDAFFAAASDDPPLTEGLAVAQRLAADHDIVYLTGRPERCQADTVAWLDRHGLPPGRLVMRRAGDRRPARAAKLGLLRRLAAERPVRVLVDDDAAVCAAAEDAGFTVLRAEWMPPRPALTDAQERDGRT